MCGNFTLWRYWSLVDEVWTRYWIRKSVILRLLLASAEVKRENRFIIILFNYGSAPANHGCVLLKNYEMFLSCPLKNNHGLLVFQLSHFPTFLFLTFWNANFHDLYIPVLFQSFHMVSLHGSETNGINLGVLSRLGGLTHWVSPLGVIVHERWARRRWPKQREGQLTVRELPHQLCSCELKALRSIASSGASNDLSI